MMRSGLGGAIAITLAALLVTAGLATAAPIAYDGFADGGGSPGAGEYLTGTASTNGKDNDSIFNQGPALTGFDSGVDWGGDAGSFASFVYFRAEGGGLNYSDVRGNALPTTAGQVNLFRTPSGTHNKTIARTSNDAATPTTTMYFSGLMQFQPSRFARMQTAWGDKSSIAVGFNASARAEIALGASGGTKGVTTDAYATGTPHLVIGKIVEGGGGGSHESVTLYVDPTNMQTEFANAAALTHVDLGNSYYVAGNAAYALNTVHLSGSVTGGSSTLFDEFRVGTTWADVAPIDGAAAPASAKQTLFAQADAFIKGDAGGGSNFGSHTQLRIKNASGASNNRKTYMRFDLAGLGFDPMIDLTGASLNFEFIDSAAGGISGTPTWEFELFGLNDGNAGEDWSEMGITWNNAPENVAGDGNALGGDVTSLGTFTRTGKGLGAVEFSSAALTNFIMSGTSDDLFTFIIVRNTVEGGGSSYVHALASRENGSVAGPQLVLTFVPEPAALAVWALGMLCFALVRRRRAS